VKQPKRMVNLRDHRSVKTIITTGHLVYPVRKLTRLATRIIDSSTISNIIFKIILVRLDIKVRIAVMISKTVNIFFLHPNVLLEILSSLQKEYKKLNKSGKALSMD